MSKCSLEKQFFVPLELGPRKASRSARAVGKAAECRDWVDGRGKSAGVQSRSKRAGVYGDYTSGQES